MEQGVNGSVRGRVGYDLNPVLVYGTAGVAASSVKATGNGGGSATSNFTLTAGISYTGVVGAQAGNRWRLYG